MPREDVVRLVNFLRHGFAKVFSLEIMSSHSAIVLLQHLNARVVGQRKWDTKSNFVILSKTFTVLKIIIISHKLKVLIH